MEEIKKRKETEGEIVPETFVLLLFSLLRYTFCVASELFVAL